ncbi:MAG: DUF4114 domain-containing protein [Elusimicrobia bacterium]|nr:DUF4114 domain-containing protein [Elusimicrobiota bacterium]
MRAWAAAAAGALALAIGLLLWRKGPHPPAEPAAPSVPKPVTPSRTSPPPIPPGTECRPIPPLARLSGARLVGLGSATPITASQLPWDPDEGKAVRVGDGGPNARMIDSPRSVDLGAFAWGREVELSIHLPGGVVFRSGPAERNPDGLPHVRVFPLGDTWMVGFEDMHGGGDRDFDDAVVLIQGDVAAELNGELWCLPKKRP